MEFSIIASSILLIFGFGPIISAPVAPKPPLEINESEIKPSEIIEIMPTDNEISSTIDIKIRPQDPVIGESTAPVTIIEFTDFECPFCKRFSDDTFKQIKQDYIDTGKVRYSVRDFPLSFHFNSLNASMAANCANEQNKFWEMKEQLFEDQFNWSVQENPKDTFTAYAKNLNLDTEKFDQCYDTDKYRTEIETDKNDGEKYGVSGTPNFFINGEPVTGAIPYENFKSVIEKHLNKR